MKIELPPLPWAKDALEPLLSKEQIEVHYEKHHRGYVEKLKKLIEDDPIASIELEAIVKLSQGDVFNNASQIWNHTHYWHSMKPGGGGEPREGRLSRAIIAEFGSLGAFSRAFHDLGEKHFGSGWIWLVYDRDTQRVAVESTHDADSPLVSGLVPLLCMDVWEHAYYVDYRNERETYVKGFLSGLVNWDFAEENLRKAV
jgi:Fe-Mn family superoxide dismutase